jgi:hypothetical protein
MLSVAVLTCIRSSLTGNPAHGGEAMVCGGRSLSGGRPKMAATRGAWGHPLRAKLADLSVGLFLNLSDALSAPEYSAGRSGDVFFFAYPQTFTLAK